MADLIDVSEALVSIVSAAIYPNGVNLSSAVGFGCKVYSGWPLPNILQTDTANNIAHVSVWPMQGERITFVERRDIGWEVVSSNADAGILRRTAKRQTRPFRVTVWANNYASRDALARLIDSAMSDIYHIAMPDDTICNIAFSGSLQIDAIQSQSLYRRDFNYQIDYATTQQKTAYKIKQINKNITQGVV